MKTALFFIFVLTSLTSLAQEESIDENLIDKDLLQNLGKMQDKERPLAPLQIEKEDTSLIDDEEYSFTGVVKPNSLLLDLKDETKKWVTPKKLIVKMKKEKGQGADFFIYDNKNVLRYRTKRKNVIDVSSVVTLQSTPKRYIEYAPPREYDGGDESLTLKSSFLVHGESFSKSSAALYELKTFYGWKLPLELGLSLSYESGKENADESTGESPVWTSYYYGPVLRYPFYKGESFVLSAETSIQKSYNFRRIAGERTEDYALNVFYFGGEILFPTSVGQFIGGLHFRTHRATLHQTSHPEETWPEQEKTTTRALSLSFGYGRDFSW